MKEENLFFEKIGLFGERALFFVLCGAKHKKCKYFDDKYLEALRKMYEQQLHHK